MPQPRLPPADAILDAARRQFLDGGLASVTMAATALASGTPLPELQEQFASPEELVVAVWERAALRSQEAFVTAARSAPDAADAALAAGLSVFDFILASPQEGRVLVSLRQDDVVRMTSSWRRRLELERLNEPMVAELGVLAKRMTATEGRAVVDSLAMATIDVPYGAVRRHLVAGRRPPARLRRGLELAIREALSTIDGARQEQPREPQRGARLRSV